MLHDIHKAFTLHYMIMNLSSGEPQAAAIGRWPPQVTSLSGGFPSPPVATDCQCGRLKPVLDHNMLHASGGMSAESGDIGDTSVVAKRPTQQQTNANIGFRSLQAAGRGLTNGSTTCSRSGMSVDSDSSMVSLVVGPSHLAAASSVVVACQLPLVAMLQQRRHDCCK